MGFYMGPIWAPYMGLGDGICKTVPGGTHMVKPIWVTNGNHMGPILDLAQVAHAQPTFRE